MRFFFSNFEKNLKESGLIMTSVSLVMSDQAISNIGDCEELASSCKNVLELDLAKNELNDWDEVSSS